MKRNINIIYSLRVRQINIKLTILKRGNGPGYWMIHTNTLCLIGTALVSRQIRFDEEMI